MSKKKQTQNEQNNKMSSKKNTKQKSTNITAKSCLDVIIKCNVASGCSLGTKKHIR